MKPTKHDILEKTQRKTGPIKDAHSHKRNTITQKGCRISTHTLHYCPKYVQSQICVFLLSLCKSWANAPCFHGQQWWANIVELLKNYVANGSHFKKNCVKATKKKFCTWKAVTWRAWMNNGRAGYEYKGLWQHGQNRNTASQLALYYEIRFPKSVTSHSSCGC